MNSANKRYDVIVIGSGMGGLTCASLLSQLAGKRVLVLEQHFKIGGFTHTFTRKGKYDWDVGLHYVGEMYEGRFLGKLFDYATQGQIQWNMMPDAYDTFVYPDLRFKVRAGIDNVKNDLVKLFPEEETSIEKYLHDIKLATCYIWKYCAARTLPASLGILSRLIENIYSRLALTTTEEYLKENFKDPKLRALIASQWGTYGLPPSQSAFAIHGLIVNHYIQGAYYPVGGADRIAESIVPIVEGVGGDFLVNHRADEIIIEQGNAIGVRVSHKKGHRIIEKEFYADIIISDAGAYASYCRLIPEDILHPTKEKFLEFSKGVPNVTLFLGLSDDPRKMGFQGENYWIYDSYDHNATYEARSELIEGKVRHCYLSFPSLKDPSAKSHTAEIIAFIDYEPFKQWVDQPWKRRNRGYEELKDIISEALIEFVDSNVGGLKNLIAYKELSTPLTTEYMTNHSHGAIYGLPATPERYKLKWLRARTPIKNLYLTGADIASHGIAGALLGGAVTAGVVMGIPLGLWKIFKESMRFSKKARE